MSQAQILYRLQQIDLDIDARRSRLSYIERELNDRSAIEAAESKVAEAEGKLSPWQRRSSDLDLQIKGLSDKIRNAEKRLYSGIVKNPKELQDMQEEIASLKRRRAALEDDLLEAMIAVEEHQKAYQEARDNLDAITARRESEWDELRREKARLESELRELEKQREKVIADLDEDALERYTALRDVKSGQPISPLSDGICSVCGVEQSTTVIQQVRRGERLITCTNCGRILVIL